MNRAIGMKSEFQLSQRFAHSRHTRIHPPQHYDGHLSHPKF